MAIKINNTTVIDDSRNAVNIPSLTFSDGTVQRTAAPVFGDTVTAGGSLRWTLSNPNAYSTSAGDVFGSSTAISGNYFLVSAYGEDENGQLDSGKVYVYNVTTGQLLYTINNPNAYSTSASDYFGNSVAISGNYAIISAYGEDDVLGSGSGKVYVYNITNGTLVWTLNNPNAYGTSTNDVFGYNIAISGKYAIVSAYNEDDIGGTESGKAYIYDITTGQLLWTLNNPNAYSTSASDSFGISVAISSNYAIVGAVSEDEDGYVGSGKAYIYNVTTGALLWTLNNPNAFSTSLNDQFGCSVAISDTFAAVGASGEDDVGGLFDAGKAYVFNTVTGKLIWTLNNISIFSNTTSDFFGQFLVMSNNYLLVSNRNDGSGNLWGSAHLYNLTTGNLIFSLSNPNPDNTNGYDFYAYGSASIDGNTIVIGAHQETDSGVTNAGRVYVYNIERIRNSNYVEEIQFTNGTTLNLLADKAFQTAHPGGALVWTLNNPNTYGTSASDNFGYSVAISGNYSIVGAWGETDSGGTFSSGKAYIFNTTTGQLVQTLVNPNPFSTGGGDNFGYSVAISGNYAIVGAWQEDDAGSGTQSGKAYIYNTTTGQFLYLLNNPNMFASSGDNFGYSVAISGNYAIVGAYAEDDAGGTQSGKAYIYNVTTGTLLWALNNPNAYGTSQDDYFGSSVAISGNFAIVGARYENDDQGSASGKAYIYNVTTGTLVQTLNNPNVYDTSASDLFGYSVSISGNYAIVGAYGEDDVSGTSSGKAYIFSTQNLTYLDKILTVAESIF